MKLNLKNLLNGEFEGKGYILPKFDVNAVRERTHQAPTWIHFGAGNILRAFPCVLCQKLLDAGEIDTGMIVVETYDEEIIDKAFTPFDNLCLAVSLKSDGTVEKRVVASVTESLGYHANAQRVAEIFTADSLQMASLTITEKGYAVTDASGAPLRYCASDFESMEHPVSAMAVLAKLLYLRYQAGARPIAMVSMDNCSHNGTILQNGIMQLVDAWQKRGIVDEGFLNYLNTCVSFTWSMIDKITPRPAQQILDMLAQEGFEGAEVVVTGKNTYVSGMVNAEECEYLAIEDRFPNGRPPLEKVGVLFGDRNTVDRIEKMKVCTCLNPLHTCLAIFGCLLGYKKISEEMKDDALVGLIRQVGYVEGMPVVTDPGVMNARTFIDEVVNLRLPNPFVPDTPQRIACDTSKKIPVRFGETLKAYLARGEKDLSFLTFIPLTFAAYTRYLMGIDDNGNAFERSPDPNLDKLSACVEGIKLGDQPAAGALRPLYENSEIFGVNLYECGLGEKTEALFAQMNQGVGCIRKTLEQYLNGVQEGSKA